MSVSRKLQYYVTAYQFSYARSADPIEGAQAGSLLGVTEGPYHDILSKGAEHSLVFIETCLDATIYHSEFEYVQTLSHWLERTAVHENGHQFRLSTLDESNHYNLDMNIMQSIEGDYPEEFYVFMPQDLVAIRERVTSPDDIL